MQKRYSVYLLCLHCKLSFFCLKFKILFKNWWISWQLEAQIFATIIVIPAIHFIPMKNRDSLLSGLFNKVCASRHSTFRLSTSTYNTPLVLGKTIFSASRFTAILIAFAKALNIASILWCSFSPSALMFRLHLDASLNDLKKCRNISVGRPPMLSRLWGCVSSTFYWAAWWIN